MTDQTTFEHVRDALLKQIKASRSTYHQFSWLIRNQRKNVTRPATKKAA